MADAKEFSVGKSKSPYKITVAPPYKRDASGEMMQAFLGVRGEQEARNNQKKQLIGNLDSLSADFVALFTNLSTIRSKIHETEALPFIGELHLRELRSLVKIVDKLNSAIVNKIIPMIDELGN